MFRVRLDPPTHPSTASSLLLVSAFCLIFLGLCSAPKGKANNASDTELAAGSINESAWERVAQKDGIDVFTRAVAGSGIKEFKAVAEVDASMKAIGGLLRDGDRFKTWFPNTPDSKLLRREGDVSYQYSVMATPWPISDRDNVLRSVTKIDREAGTVHITVAAAPDAHPEQSDRVRVQKANGSWILEALDDTKTRVTFQMHLEPGGGIPQWMINARVVETPLEAIANMRRTLKAN